MSKRRAQQTPTELDRLKKFKVDMSKKQSVLLKTRPHDNYFNQRNFKWKQTFFLSTGTPKTIFDNLYD